MNYPYYSNYQSQYSQPQYSQPYAQPQISQGSTFVSVRNIQEAQNYPVAPNTSVMFKDENAPYVYTKTMGASQLDRPVFEVFKLVKENVAPQATDEYDYKGEIERLKTDVEWLKDLMEGEKDA